MASLLLRWNSSASATECPLATAPFYPLRADDGGSSGPVPRRLVVRHPADQVRVTPPRRLVRGRVTRRLAVRRMATPLRVEAAIVACRSPGP
jgi:hypothetical protein